MIGICLALAGLKCPGIRLELECLALTLRHSANLIIHVFVQ